MATRQRLPVVLSKLPIKDPVKNRKLLMLSGLVIGIWGLIGYRVLAYLDEDTTLRYATPKAPPADTVSQVSYALALSYPDPFLKTRSLPPVQPAKPVQRMLSPRKKKPDAVVPTVMIDWSKVKYLGLMSNTSRKIRTATVRLDGKDYFVKEGETLQEIMVLEARPDSIWVSMGNTKAWIRKARH